MLTTTSDAAQVSDLKSLMTHLSHSQNTLKSYLETLKPSHRINEDSIRSVLQALHPGLTESTIALLPSGHSSGDLQFAAKLAENYLQSSKNQKEALLQFGDQVSDRDDSKLRSLITNVINDRSKLEQRVSALAQPSDAVAVPVEVQTPVQSSPNFCDAKTNVSLDEFMAYLKETEHRLQSRRKRGETLSASEINHLIRNWQCAVDRLQPISVSPDVNPKVYQDAIAHMIQIHDLLEESFSELAEIARSGDLLSPAIL